MGLAEISGCSSVIARSSPVFLLDTSFRKWIPRQGAEICHRQIDPDGGRIRADGGGLPERPRKDSEEPGKRQPWRQVLRWHNSIDTGSRVRERVTARLPGGPGRFRPNRSRCKEPLRLYPA